MLKSDKLFITNDGFFLVKKDEFCSRTMTREIYATLSAHGRRICRYMVVGEGEAPRFEGQQYERWSHATDGWKAPDHALARL